MPARNSCMVTLGTMKFYGHLRHCGKGFINSIVLSLIYSYFHIGLVTMKFNKILFNVLMTKNKESYIEVEIIFLYSKGHKFSLSPDGIEYFQDL